MNREFAAAGRMRWGWFIAVAVLLLLLPLVSETHTATLLAIWSLFALSLGLMWGYAGILSFGHAAYFGLGAYTYAITAMNTGESTGALLLAILLPAFVAAVIGAMMFYGRISDVYMGVITLVFALILAKFMGATAGDAYRIGAARLGGFNGIPAFPVLNVPGDTSIPIYGTGLYYVVMVCLLGCYLLARWVLASAFGRVLLGIRENEARVELHRVLAGICDHLQPRLPLRVQRIGDPARHPRGEAFVQPEVIPPCHGHKIAKPHMRDFVRDGRVDELALGFRREIGVDERIFFEEEDGAPFVYTIQRRQRSWGRACANDNLIG